jgi:tetratricopeptide (TPR) repeat protein
MSDDWFRNTAWNETIAAHFEEKLGKARRKEQYLRIQASVLASTHPKIALQLLERYFALPDDFDHAQAHVDRAAALIALGRIDEALASYEAALRREVEFPKLQTETYLTLPYFIAVRGIEDQYDRALELLDEHKTRLMFPVDHFRWHAAHALILGARGQEPAATTHAKQALEAASRDKSEFRYHPSIGLVTENYTDVLEKLARYCDA